MAYLSDELSHAGVKGMKWGVRKVSARGERRAARKEERKQQDLQIVGARLRQQKRVANLSNTAAKTYVQTTKKGQEAALKAYERAEKKLLTNPDAATAQKLTSGEKATQAVGLSIFAVGLAGMAALTIAAGNY
jgi:hypothetical protein